MARPIQRRVRERPPTEIRRLHDAPMSSRVELLATMESDTEGGVERVEHGGRIGRGWLGPVAVVLVAGALIAFGLFGANPSNTPLPVPTVPDVKPSPVLPAPTPEPSFPETAQLPALHPDLPSIAVNPALIHSAILPSDVDPSMVAVAGSRVVYATTDGVLATIDLASRSSPSVIATLPACHRVADLAASGNHVIWADAWPTSASGTGTCVTHKPLATEWRIWLSDLDGRNRHQVAHGSASIGAWGTALEPSVGTPSVALTPSQYAFDAPAITPQGRLTAIEVHDIVSRRRLWEVLTQGPVGHLELGADRIAYMQQDAVLSVTTRQALRPTLVAATDSSFSMSEDGRFLAWDEDRRVFFADFRSDVPQIRLLGPTDVGQTASSPAVGSDSAGPVVFWRGTDAAGRSYLVVRPSLDATPMAIDDAPSPTGGVIEGGSLVWKCLVPLPDGRSWEAVFSLELADVIPPPTAGPVAWAAGASDHG